MQISMFFAKNNIIFPIILIISFILSITIITGCDKGEVKVIEKEKEMSLSDASLVQETITYEIIQEKDTYTVQELISSYEDVLVDISDMKEFAFHTFDYVFSQYDPVSLSMKPAEAIKELARVAKKGSYVIVVVDTKYRRVSELIEAKQIDKAHELLETNISYDFQHPQYNLTWEELELYFEQAKLDVIEVVGAPVFMHQVKEEILDELEKNPEIRQKLLDMELEYCTVKSLVNFAGHLMMIGKKR